MVRFGRGFPIPARGHRFSPVIADAAPDGWDIWIDGASIKDKIQMRDRIVIKLNPNELSEMTFRTLWSANYVPDQFKEIYAFSMTGVKIFGGVVRFRRVGMVGTSSRYADVTCQSWWFYLTVSFVTVTITVSCTLREIIAAIIGQLPSSHGFGMDPAQPDGPTFPTGYSTGENAKAAEVFRKLESDTAELGGYVVDVTPTKVISMSPAGTVAAPLTITDAAPHCRAASWSDPNEPTINHLRLVCGSADDVSLVEHVWVATGSVFVFSLAGLNIPASAEIMNITDVDGTEYPTWQPGASPGHDGIEWDPHTGDGTLTFLGSSQALIPAASVITIRYQPQRPFTVVASTGATPQISDVRIDTSVRHYAEGVARAEGLLAQISQTPQQLEIFSIDEGWRPSQSVPVQLTTLGLDATFTIGSVTITIGGELKWWEYRFTAQQTAIVQPGRLARLRGLIAAVANQLSSGTTTTSGASASASLYGTSAMLVPTTYAGLPTPAEGMAAWITDSDTDTWGDVIGGGGAFKVLGVYNGSDWKVAGK